MGISVLCRLGRHPSQRCQWFFTCNIMYDGQRISMSIRNTDRAPSHTIFSCQCGHHCTVGEFFHEFHEVWCPPARKIWQLLTVLLWLKWLRMPPSCLYCLSDQAPYEHLLGNVNASSENPCSCVPCQGSLKCLRCSFCEVLSIFCYFSNAFDGIGIQDELWRDFLNFGSGPSGVVTATLMTVGRTSQ